LFFFKVMDFSESVSASLQQQTEISKQSIDYSKKTVTYFWQINEIPAEGYIFIQIFNK
jgi:hypothetical protein